MPDTTPSPANPLADAARKLKAARGGTRLEMAHDPATEPEVLYYLVEDDDSSVRAAVAANPATPPQADLLLAEDTDDEVRQELARKIGRLMPGLQRLRQTKLREMTIEALETLAQDRLPTVRAALSDTIKEMDCVPHDVVMQLARDVETIVAAPILEYSPLLNDADLVELMAAGVTIGALPALARRHGLSADVADAVVATADMPSIAALLHNRSANFREKTLDRIAKDAAETEDLHEPLALRPELSQRTMRRIASFLSRALLEQLSEKSGLDNRTRRSLAKALSAKLADDGDADEKLDADFADHLAAQGKLDDDVIQSAIGRNRAAFVARALALKSGRSNTGVQRILEMRNGKATVALVWQAGLSMRTALLVQQRIAKVPPSQIVPARNGVDFPLSPDEMDVQIAHIPD